MFEEYYHGDIIEKFRPLSDWRKRLQSDPDALLEAANLWREVSCELLYIASGRPGKVINIPNGYADLNYVLAWCCDAGPFSIDSTPLYSALKAANAIASYGRTEQRGEAIAALDRFQVEFEGAAIVLGRLVYAAHVQHDIEPPNVWDGPLSPSQWCVKFGRISLATFSRWKGTKFQYQVITTKSILIRRDDVMRLEKT